MESNEQAPAQQQSTQQWEAQQQRRRDGAGESGTQRSPTSHAQTETSRTRPEDGRATGAAAPQPAAPRFNALRRLGKFISGLGWLAVIVGVLIALLIFFGGYAVGIGRDLGFGGMATGGLAGLAAGFSISVYGLLLVATGQLFSCFVAIERNTRSTHEMMRTQQR